MLIFPQKKKTEEVLSDLILRYRDNNIKLSNGAILNQTVHGGLLPTFVGTAINGLDTFYFNGSSSIQSNIKIPMSAVGRNILTDSFVIEFWIKAEYPVNNWYSYGKDLWYAAPFILSMNNLGLMAAKGVSEKIGSLDLGTNRYYGPNNTFPADTWMFVRLARKEKRYQLSVRDINTGIFTTIIDQITPTLLSHDISTSIIVGGDLVDSRYNYRGHLAGFTLKIGDHSYL